MRRSLMIVLFLGLLSRGSAGTAPMTLHDSMAIVEARINGSQQSLNLLVDCGAEETVICSRRAKKIGLSMASRESVRTVSGIESAWRTNPVEVSLGGSTVLRKSLLVLDLRAESRALGVRIDGLLGADFFGLHAVRLGFRSKRLDWQSSAPLPAKSTLIPLRRDRGALFVKVHAADVTLSRVRLDTGCRHSLCWAPDGSGTVSRPWRNGSSKTIPLRLGSAALPEIQTRTYRHALISGEDGLLGNGFLTRFDAIWIDASAGHLVLESSS